MPTKKKKPKKPERCCIVYSGTKTRVKYLDENGNYTVEAEAQFCPVCGEKLPV